MAARARSFPAAIDGLTDVQRRTRALVAGNPGLTIQQAAVRLGVSHSTATYHLQTLLRLGLVEALRHGRELRHFVLPRGSSRAAYVESLLDDPRRCRLLNLLAEAPVERLTINRIAAGARLSFGFTKRTLAQLDDMALVDLERRSYRYRVSVRPELVAIVRDMLAGSGQAKGQAAPRREAGAGSPHAPGPLAGAVGRAARRAPRPGHGAGTASRR